ncbi:MAG: TRAP transporter large permease [Rhodovibrionaceae bacterium]
MSGFDLMLTLGLVVLLLLGMPFAFSIGIAVVLALVIAEIDTVVLVQHMMAGISIYTLLAVPCFILAGDLMHTGGLSRRLVVLAMVLARHFRGGLAMVAVLSATFFGAISGSAPATTAAIGKIMIPEMERHGYKRGFAAALAAADGPIGIMIPPSIPMVIWAVIANVSVTDLFLAGIFPGLLCCVALCAVSSIYARVAQVPVDSRPASWGEVATAMKEGIWALLAPVIVLGGIYGGVFTPTEAGAIGVLYGLVVGLFLHRELKLGDLPVIVMRAMRTTAMVIFIVGMSAAFGWLVALEQLPERLSGLILAFSDHPILILLVVNVLLLLVGAVMDTIAAMIILAGLLIQIGVQLGLDPIHFGAIVVVNLAIGMSTPPFGYTLFTAAGISDVSVERIVRYLWPMLIAQIAVLLLVTYVPAVTLTLPSLF